MLSGKKPAYGKAHLVFHSLKNHRPSPHYCLWPWIMHIYIQVLWLISSHPLIHPMTFFLPFFLSHSLCPFWFTHFLKFLCFHDLSCGSSTMFYQSSFPLSWMPRIQQILCKCYGNWMGHRHLNKKWQERTFSSLKFLFAEKHWFPHPLKYSKILLF